MLIAFCELRQQIRHFRLSRMSDLHILNDKFTPPADFNLQDYVTLRVRQPEEVLQRVLGWGANVTVLEPESLIRLVRDEAANMLQRY